MPAWFARTIARSRCAFAGLEAAVVNALFLGLVERLVAVTVGVADGVRERMDIGAGALECPAQCPRRRHDFAVTIGRQHPNATAKFFGDRRERIRHRSCA